MTDRQSHRWKFPVAVAALRSPTYQRTSTGCSKTPATTSMVALDRVQRPEGNNLSTSCRTYQRPLIIGKRVDPTRFPEEDGGTGPQSGEEDVDPHDHQTAVVPG